MKYYHRLENTATILIRFFLRKKQTAYGVRLKD